MGLTLLCSLKHLRLIMDMYHIILLITMALSITGLNVNGFNSSEEYVRFLLKNNDLLGISEHWFAGTELNNLNIESSHTPVSSCNRNLINGPPKIGRGYGGVAI